MNGERRAVRMSASAGEVNGRRRSRTLVVFPCCLGRHDFRKSFFVCILSRNEGLICFPGRLVGSSFAAGFQFLLRKSRHLKSSRWDADKVQIPLSPSHHTVVRMSMRTDDSAPWFSMILQDNAW